MKRLIILFALLSGLFFVKDVNAQTGCCTGSVTTGTAYCPNDPNKTNWYCTNTSTAYSCGGLDYSTCINTRPSSSSEISCGGSVARCTGCGWSSDCSGSGGGPGYVFPTCPSGQTLVCNSPAQTQCLYKGECGNLFPSRWNDVYCDSNNLNKKQCQTNCACVTSSSGLPPSTAPTGLSPTSTLACSTTSTTTVSFSWNAVSGATMYFLRIDDLSNGGWVQCNSGSPSISGDFCIPGINSTSYNKVLPSGRSYKWWVHGYNAYGDGPLSSMPTFSAPACSVSTPTPTRAPTATPRSTSTPTIRPTNTPTLPPSCTTGSWVSGACSGGSCTSGRRLWTRTVSPTGCTYSTQCLIDSSCSPTPTIGPTATPIPSCTISTANLSPSTVTLSVGGTASLSLTVNDSPGGCTQDAVFVRNNTSTTVTTTNPDLNEPFTTTVRCDSVGQTTITGQARNGGVVRASDTTTVTCVSGPTPTRAASTPTLPPSCTATAWVNSTCGGGSCLATQRLQTRTVSPIGCVANTRCVSDSTCFVATPTPTPRPTATPTPAMCRTPRPNDPPLVTCGNPGRVKWEWDDVAGVNQYNLVIDQLNAGTWSVVDDFNWQNASFFGSACNGDGAGLCSRTETRPAGGTFRSRIRARNSLINGCMPSAFDTSSQVFMYQCASMSLPDVEINGILNSQNVIVTSSNLTSPMTFSVNDPTIASVDPLVDTPAYQTTASSIGLGTTDYSATAVDGGGNPISDTATITVLNPRPWCQAKEGEVIARGDVVCPIPASCTVGNQCSPYLITNDAGDAPGVVVAGQSIDEGAGQSSRSPFNLRITGETYGGQNYDYTYLVSKASAASFSNVSVVSAAGDLTSGTPYDGYIWKRSAGDLTISNNIDLGSGKVVLFVNGDLNINGKINLTNGTGFLMAIVNGNINVNFGVRDSGALGSLPDTNPELEGIYFAEGNLVTGSAGDDSDQQLHIRGSVVASGFDMDRDLQDNSNAPSELFEFGPDQILRIPGLLSRKQVIWREVAP